MKYSAHAEALQRMQHEYMQRHGDICNKNTCRGIATHATQMYFRTEFRVLPWWKIYCSLYIPDHAECLYKNVMKQHALWMMKGTIECCVFDFMVFAQLLKHHLGLLPGCFYMSVSAYARNLWWTCIEGLLW